MFPGMQCWMIPISLNEILLLQTSLFFPQQGVPTSVLYVFADASPIAYRAVACIHCGNHSSLVIVKQHSLDLMAAAVEVCLESDKSFNLNANMYYWSDNQILLCRLKKEAKLCIEQRVKLLHCLGNTAQQLAIKQTSRCVDWLPNSWLIQDCEAMALHSCHLLLNAPPGCLQKPCSYRQPVAKSLNHLLVSTAQPCCHLLMTCTSL